MLHFQQRQVLNFFLSSSKGNGKKFAESNSNMIHFISKVLLKNDIILVLQIAKKRLEFVSVDFIFLTKLWSFRNLCCNISCYSTCLTLFCQSTTGFYVRNLLRIIFIFISNNLKSEVLLIIETSPAIG